MYLVLVPFVPYRFCRGHVQGAEAKCHRQIFVRSCHRCVLFAFHLATDVCLVLDVWVDWLGLQGEEGVFFVNLLSIRIAGWLSAHDCALALRPHLARDGLLHH